MALNSLQLSKRLCLSKQELSSSKQRVVSKKTLFKHFERLISGSPSLNAHLGSFRIAKKLKAESKPFVPQFEVMQQFELMMHLWEQIPEEIRSDFLQHNAALIPSNLLCDESTTGCPECGCVEFTDVCPECGYVEVTGGCSECGSFECGDTCEFDSDPESYDENGEIVVYDEYEPSEEFTRCKYGFACPFGVVCNFAHTQEEGAFFIKQRNTRRDLMLGKIAMAPEGTVFTPMSFATRNIPCGFGKKCRNWNAGVQCPFLHPLKELVYFATGRDHALLEGTNTLQLEDIKPFLQPKAPSLLQLEAPPLLQLEAPPLLQLEAPPLLQLEAPPLLQLEETTPDKWGCCNRRSNWLFSWLFGK